MKIRATTRVFAILGDPVVHSLSPAMHNAGFQAAGIDAVYVAMQPHTHALADTMRTLVRSGGGGNVTIPFKQLAAAGGIADRRVAVLESANVFAGDLDGVALGNTDVDGVLAAVDLVAPGATSWCVVGTGGSARAVAGAAAERGARLGVRSRDPARAERFSAWAATIGVPSMPVGDCRVVINATPLGLQPGDAFPIDPGTLDSAVAVVDLVYLPDGDTRWVRACHARGLNAIDGREVLVIQGAMSWRRWFSDIAPPIEVMRAAVDGRLG